MRHFLLICICLVAIVVLAEAKAVPADPTPGDAVNQVANAPLSGFGGGRSLKGANDITGGATGGGTGGILTGIGRIIRGALTGAGNIVGGALGGGN
ncbi:hypothetical protein AVEN_130363-1 [Araneus ventricosus]|uniref:Uncharacterized protein n=1 Tax=Araneus ventricosus TaxID=182803 RepID=A0A4Y2BGI1_ARAVE|nr:hypothetical protein AVEN_130363-1 [Araneus ventricosus]